jgi:DNA-binding transcriptional MerR regulator
MAKALTIGQVAAATGVAPRTIRYYEQVGVLPSPARTRSGYRQYDERGLERLLFVRRARALRLPLHHVRALTATLDGVANGAMRPRLLALVRAQLAAVRGRIAELGLLREELERVLRRLPSASRDGHGCRCLEAPDEPRREARVPRQSPAARLRRRG